jgi:hypothetical protein
MLTFSETQSSEATLAAIGRRFLALVTISTIDFAEGKPGKNCLKGLSCGDSCISKLKICVKAMNPEQVSLYKSLLKSVKAGDANAQKAIDKIKGKQPAKLSGAGKKPTADKTDQKKPVGDTQAKQSALLSPAAIKELDSLAEQYKNADRDHKESGARLVSLFGKVSDDELRRAMVEHEEGSPGKTKERVSAQMAKLLGDYRKQLVETGLSQESAAKLAEETKVLGLGKDKTAAVKEALMEFHQITNGALSGKVGVIVGGSGRAMNDDNGTVYVSKADKREVFHEAAHSLETPELRKRHNNWIAKRSVDGGDLHSLSDLDTDGLGLSPDEFAVKDDFYTPYVGRFYGHTALDKMMRKKTKVKGSGSATEVMSMGLEKFLDPEGMAELYHKDREHFMMMHDYLGSQRNV